LKCTAKKTLLEKSGKIYEDKNQSLYDTEFLHLNSSGPEAISYIKLQVLNLTLHDVPTF
jgi:hypothetical protein